MGAEHDDDPIERRWRAFGPVLYSRCRRLLGTDAAADDAAQLLFHRLFSQLHGDPRAALEIAFAAATRYCDDEWKKPRPASHEDPGRHPARVLVDLDLAGLTRDRERQKLAAHVSTCPECQRHRDAVAADRARFESLVLPRSLPRVERDARPPWIIRYVLWFAPLLVLAAMVVMILALKQEVFPAVALERDGTARLIPAGRRFALAATVDAEANVTVVFHGPVHGETAVAVPRTHQRVRVFGVFSHRPIDPASARAALARSRIPSLPGAVVVSGGKMPP